MFIDRYERARWADLWIAGVIGYAVAYNGGGWPWLLAGVIGYWLLDGVLGWLHDRFYRPWLARVPRKRGRGAA